MKKYIQIVAVLFSLAVFSCTNSSKSTDTTEELHIEEELKGVDPVIDPSEDSTVRLKGGAQMPVIITQADSINLPEQLETVIRKTEGIGADSILVTRRFIEDNITYFEFEFLMKDGKNKKITYDETGKIKSDDED